MTFADFDCDDLHPKATMPSQVANLHARLPDDVAEALGFRVYIGHDRPDRRVSVPAIRAPRRPLGGAS